MKLADWNLTAEQLKALVSTYMIDTYERFDFVCERAKGMYLYADNGDAYLDAGECVVATNIELMGRRDCTGFVWAVWADPPPAPSTLDSDGDGLPDAYEKSYFGLNPYNFADAAKDVDRDGMTAWEEWVAGTDPSLAASVLSMEIQVHPDGGVDVSWPTVTGRTYVVESGLDGWTPLPGGVPTGPTTSPSSGFFRVRAQKGTTP